MNLIKKALLALLIPIIGFVTFSSFADNESDINKLLTAESMPAGVIFEVVGRDGDYLKQAFEKVEGYKEQLRKKFPEIKIAVVSHGSEQFSLVKEKAKEFDKTHKKIKHLIDSDVPVYVCGNHSRLRGVDTKKFPKYLKIAKRGPLQIKHYQDLGFTLIVIE